MPEAKAPIKLSSPDQLKDALGGQDTTETKILPKKEKAKILAKKVLEALRAKTKEKKIEEIVEHLKQGVTAIVIHGKTVRTENGTELKEQNDLDTDGALDLFTQANIKYKSTDGTITSTPNIEVVGKGQKTQKKYKDGDIIVHIDSGGEGLEIRTAQDGSTHIFIDHHYQHDELPTSAAEDTYKILAQAGFIEKSPERDALIEMITNYDNLSYAQSKQFNADVFRNVWPKSMYALIDTVPYTQLKQWIAEGKDPMRPEFTQEELDTIKFKRERPTRVKGGIKKRVEEEITLGNYIKEVQEKVRDDMERSLPIAEQKMEKLGIKNFIEGVGKVLYISKDPEVVNGKNQFNKLNYAFLAARASGYDALVACNQGDNSFFVNVSAAQTARLIFERLQMILPGITLVRDVMIVPSSNNEERKLLNKDTFLKMIGLKRLSMKQAAMLEALLKETLSSKEATKTSAALVKAMSFGKTQEELLAMGFTVTDIRKALKEGKKRASQELPKHQALLKNEIYKKLYKESHNTTNFSNSLAKARDTDNFISYLENEIAEDTKNVNHKEIAADEDMKAYLTNKIAENTEALDYIKTTLAQYDTVEETADVEGEDSDTEIVDKKAAFMQAAQLLLIKRHAIEQMRAELVRLEKEEAGQEA